MGTWDAGPFDNDKAADWCGNLNDAGPAEREDMIRRALREAADEGGYLRDGPACVAIAAAAIVASQRPDGEAITSPFAPDFLLEDPVLDLSPDLASLAVGALDRVMGDESEWRELWDDARGELRDASFDGVRRLRAALSA